MLFVELPSEAAPGVPKDMHVTTTSSNAVQSWWNCICLRSGPCTGGPDYRPSRLTAPVGRAPPGRRLPQVAAQQQEPRQRLVRGTATYGPLTTAGNSIAEAATQRGRCLGPVQSLSDDLWQWRQPITAWCRLPGPRGVAGQLWLALLPPQRCRACRPRCFGCQERLIP